VRLGLDNVCNGSGIAVKDERRCYDANKQSKTAKICSENEKLMREAEFGCVAGMSTRDSILRISIRTAIGPVLKMLA
jgi:hypothetical protein